MELTHLELVLNRKSSIRSCRHQRLLSPRARSVQQRLTFTFPSQQLEQLVQLTLYFGLVADRCAVAERGELLAVGSEPRCCPLVRLLKLAVVVDVLLQTQLRLFRLRHERRVARAQLRRL